MNWEGRMLSRRALLKGAAATSGGLILNRAGFASAPPASGASTHVQSYVLPSLSNGVDIIPILTTGEYADNGYRMVGNSRWPGSAERWQCPFAFHAP